MAKKYRIGSYFMIEGMPALLAQVSFSSVALIDLASGNRMQEGREVDDVFAIPLSEIQRMSIATVKPTSWGVFAMDFQRRHA